MVRPLFSTKVLKKLETVHFSQDFSFCQKWLKLGTEVLYKMWIKSLLGAQGQEMYGLAAIQHKS
jgi:hypothetical protein